MTLHSNVKYDEVKAPQSPLVRHLGLIKAVTVIMAVLIVVALAIVVTTIYSRLTNIPSSVELVTSLLTVPQDARIISASAGQNGQMLLVVERIDGQQLWYLDSTGRIERTIDIRVTKQ